MTDDLRRELESMLMHGKSTADVDAMTFDEAIAKAKRAADSSWGIAAIEAAERAHARELAELQRYRDREHLVDALLECFEFECHDIDHEYLRIPESDPVGRRAGNAAWRVRTFKVTE